MVKADWVSVDLNPEEIGWFTTVNKTDLSTIPRYWDGDAWWVYSNHPDNRTLVPNNSLLFYTPIQKYKD